MDQAIRDQVAQIKNFIFIGEAGSGKSEIAINFAKELTDDRSKEVHFFDMDMTKPLFRARDAVKEMEGVGISVHFETQFEDAPTQVGGVDHHLKNGESYVVMDVGGDDIGARLIGGYAGWLNRDNTAVFYILNAFRPWSDTIEHIDHTLGKILGASRIRLDRLMMVSNPNLGPGTTAEDFIEGSRRMEEILSPYAAIAFACAREDLMDDIRRLRGGRDAAENKAGADQSGAAGQHKEVPILPIHLYLTYEWAEA